MVILAMLTYNQLLCYQFTKQESQELIFCVLLLNKITVYCPISAGKVA